MNENFYINTQTIKERTIIKTKSFDFSVVYINSGTGKYIQNQTIDIFLPHSIFLLSKETELSITPTTKIVCTITEIHFKSNLLEDRKTFSQAIQFLQPFADKINYCTCLTLSSANNHGIYPFLDIIANEYQDIKPLSLFIIQNTLASLIVYITRIYNLTTFEDETKKVTTKANLIEHVKTTIENNYSQQISLDTIAKQYYVNPSYLSHCFKKKVGISLTDFLITTRINQAKLLLLDTEELIIDIASSCGFNTIAHFNTCFKKLEHVTPTEFRNKYKIRSRTFL
ncbi:MAG: helix-turn-helix domain-containing protein [Anaerorhabdus sp.]|uniref:helix-turn-helix domain-containing protein n=1 Tax=Anaerorhabdus sp. TaxID=1872524 RepID=UPI003A8C3BD4